MDWDGLIVLYRGWSRFVDNDRKIIRLSFSQIQSLLSWSNRNFNTILHRSNTKKKQ